MPCAYGQGVIPKLRTAEGGGRSAYRWAAPTADRLSIRIAAGARARIWHSQTDKVAADKLHIDRDFC